MYTSTYTHHIFNKISELPLEFAKPLADIEVKENQEIFLTCTVSKPDLTATWYRNNVKVSASETLKLSCEGDVHTLCIPCAKLTDEAEYSIKVDGNSSKARVKVIGNFYFSQIV